MLASSEDDRALGGHPFWYAQVLGIFHVVAKMINQPEYSRVDFLWVRWLGKDLEYGKTAPGKRLDRVGFVDDLDDNDTPFGFIDPNHIIRAAHLIPDFVDGRQADILSSPSFTQDPLEDWSYFYVNRYFHKVSCCDLCLNTS
jgi:hypothetical protein